MRTGGGALEAEREIWDDDTLAGTPGDSGGLQQERHVVPRQRRTAAREQKRVSFGSLITGDGGLAVRVSTNWRSAAKKISPYICG